MKTSHQMRSVASEITKFKGTHGYRLDSVEQNRLFEAARILMMLADDLDEEMRGYHRRKDASTA